jgi:hypothetical protein
MEAQKLFNVSKEKETVVDRLEELIAILDDANSTALSYKTIVEGDDPDNTMSEHKKENIQMKARYLAQAYIIAIEEMPLKPWNDCCLGGNQPVCRCSHPLHKKCKISGTLEC